MFAHVVNPTTHRTIYEEIGPRMQDAYRLSDKGGAFVLSLPAKGATAE